MDIFLSVNNRAEVLQIPVVPSEFQVAKPQGNSLFETIKYGDLQLYGTPKLETISWNAFFPAKDYPFLRSRQVWGYDYIAKIDSWIERKLPIRLIMTDTTINMAVLVDDFNWRMGTDGSYVYDIVLRRFPMPQIGTDGSWINR